jgi:putative ABC transport system permease protein
MSGLLSDMRFALRTLARAPGYTIAVTALLGVGIGANTAMFSIIHQRLLRPLPYEEPSRLVLARCTFGGRINPMVSAPDYYDYRDQADKLQGFSAVLPFAVRTTVLGGEEPERVALSFAEHDLFQTLGVAPVAGRSFTRDEGRPGGPAVVMLSERFARRRFGDAREAVGATLAIDGQPSFVVGVLPATFRLFTDVDAWRPMRRGEGIASVGRQFHNWLIVGRLAPGVSRDSAQRQLDVISKRLEKEHPESNADKALRLDPLDAALSESYRRRILLLMGAVALVLLVACANVAGLQVARVSARRAELAIRMALGASRTQTARLLLAESMTLGLLSGIAGVALALWLARLLPVTVALADVGDGSGGPEWTVLLFALALSGLVGVVAGAAPGLHASAAAVAGEMQPGARSGGHRAGMALRRGLVAGQVALSLVLAAGAGLLIHSFAQLMRSDPGFETGRLLTGEVELPQARYGEADQRIGFFDGLRDDLANAPGVRAVGVISSLPIRNPSFDLPAWDASQPPPEAAYRRTARRRVVLPGYFNAVGIPLLSGRDFSRGDRADAPRTMIISKAMAHTLFPGGTPLGQRVSVDMFRPQPVTFEVVGVVGDVRVDSIASGTPMTMYLSYYQLPDATMRFAIRTELRPETMGRTVRQLVSARDPGLVVERLVSMEGIIGESLAPQGATATLSALLAAVALLLACLGLYGTLAHWVAQRRREIGVRKALGAEPGDLVRLVMKQGMTLAALGVVVGLAGALALSSVMAGMLFEIRPTDPVTFGAAAVILLGVTASATYVAARRAVGIEPAEALRCE